MRHPLNTGLALGLLLSVAAGCRGDLPLIHSEEEDVTPPYSGGHITGFYLLNEGNMGSNKATLDYFDYTTGMYARNIYNERNPDVVKGLGDVGNDIAIYGDKLYAVINCSHMVEVMDAHTAKHIGSIDVSNCRYITFCNGKAYVSSYAGPVQTDPEARPGKIVEIDTISLQKTREVVVGYQPEEMTVIGNQLFVANSGGYRYPNYDRTVSVVDLQSFQVTNTIDVAINLHRMEQDRYGNIYVSSRGDYSDIGSDIYIIDSHTQKVTGQLGFAASEMWMSGDSLYVISMNMSQNHEDNLGKKAAYIIYDVKQQTVRTRSFITDGTQISLPYGLAVNPESKEIFITDATNYVTPGYLYCFSPEGKLRWRIGTGDIPSRMVFTIESPSPVPPILRLRPLSTR